MQPTFLKRHPGVQDALGIVAFIVSVAIATAITHAFFIQTFSVIGPSMQSTLYTGDRLVVNRAAVTWENVQHKEYTPERNQIIVFQNPNYTQEADTSPQYIVKRTIAFAGERVTVKNGVLRVYNQKNPEGFDPTKDVNIGSMASPASGDVDMIVPDGNLFVVGDHRIGSFSEDSRSGLGTIPLRDIIGPAMLRIWPLEKFGGLPH